MHVNSPQGVIDKLMDIEDADLVIGVFWKRLAPQPHRRTPAPSTSCAGHGRFGRSGVALR